MKPGEIKDVVQKFEPPDGYDGSLCAGCGHHDYLHFSGPNPDCWGGTSQDDECSCKEFIPDDDEEYENDDYDGVCSGEIVSETENDLLTAFSLLEDCQTTFEKMLAPQRGFRLNAERYHKVFDLSLEISAFLHMAGRGL